MDSNDKINDNYYEETNEEIDIDKLNKEEKEKFEKDFLSIITKKDNDDEVAKNKIKNENKKEVAAISCSTSVSDGGEDPLSRFKSIKQKIDNLEKDIKSYSEHNNLIADNISLEKCFNKFKILKDNCDILINSGIIPQLKKLTTIHLIKKRLIENLNLHLINRANIINNLKDDYPELINNINFELLITPENKKIKKFSKILEIKQKIQKIKEKIGKWDMEKKKNIVTTVDELKKNIKYLDKDFQEEVEKRKNIIIKNIKDIDDNRKFYDSIDLNYLDEYFNNYENAEQVENKINGIVDKVEKSKTIHEERAINNIKLKELIEHQVKLGKEINYNAQILTNFKKSVLNNLETLKKNLELIKNRINSKK